MHQNDLRPTEAAFPCHQVGAETQRERDTGKAPPTHRLHVCWARRPLTPSRAAILALLLPADADPESFVDWGHHMQVAIELPNDFVGMQTEQAIVLEVSGEGYA